MPEDILLVIARGVALSVLALLWIIVLVRFTGLRAFSKMTSFDFVATVATGSLLAGAAQATNLSGFMQASLAIAGLMAAQVLLQKVRHASSLAERAIQNEPVLLMENDRIDEGALAVTRVRRADLLAKLRESNVLDFAEVRAVVLETTGDISVLHGQALSDDMLDGVRRQPGGSLVVGNDGP